MVTFFDWGEYALWHLYSGIKVSMDGRRETIYPRTVYDEDQAFLFGVGRWDALLARGNPSLVLMSRNFAADNLLRQSPSGMSPTPTSGARSLSARAARRSVVSKPTCRRRPAVPDEAPSLVSLSADERHAPLASAGRRRPSRKAPRRSSMPRATRSPTWISGGICASAMTSGRAAGCRGETSIPICRRTARTQPRMAGGTDDVARVRLGRRYRARPSEAAPDFRDRRAHRPAPALVRSDAAGVQVLIAVTSILLFLPGFGTVRPQQFSYLLFTITLLLLSGTTERPRLAWWLPVRGGGLGQSAWSRPHRARRDRRVVGRRAICFVGDRRVRASRRSAGSRVVRGPGRESLGPGDPRVPSRRRVDSGELTEWNPIEFAGLEGALHGTALVFAVLGCTGRWRPRWPAMVVVACTAVAPLLARRHLPFFVLATAVFACPAMVRHVQDVVAARWPSAMAREEGPPWRAPVVSMLFLEASLLLLLSVPRSAALPSRPDIILLPRSRSSRQPMRTGRIATFFDWGGFVLDTLGPQLQVSIDPRRETVYGGEAYGLNEQFMLGLGDWDAVLVHEPRPDLALVSKAFPTFNLMQSHPGWSLVIEDQAGGLFVRDESTLAAAVRRAAPAVPPSEVRCFAAARAWLGGSTERPRAGVLGARGRTHERDQPPTRCGCHCTRWPLPSGRLFFLIQPMFARVVLPPLGGAPAVWTTSVLFFQVLLLTAYLHAHALGRNGFTPASAALHLVVVAAGVLWLPLDIGWTRTLAAGSPPAWRLVVAATAALGLPLFAVAATAPLVQRWLTAINPAKAIGIHALRREQRRQLGGLLAYPFFLERIHPLSVQSHVWQAGYTALALCLVAVAIIAHRHRLPTTEAARFDDPRSNRVSWRHAMGWLVRAAVASGLMQSVTVYLTTDVAASPFLWVAPLSAYLVSIRDRVRTGQHVLTTSRYVAGAGRWTRDCGVAPYAHDRSGVAAVRCSPGGRPSSSCWAVTSALQPADPPRVTSPPSICGSASEA